MTGPLSGYRVIDTTAMVSGPHATMILADQGADVIKVERPDTGDYTRLAPNQRNGYAASFLNNNRNKRSVALNLKHRAGLQAILRMAAKADVFIQNFRPGVAERMGIGEQAIRAHAPDIVYVSISGFGEDGPYAAKPVYDPLVQALSGLATVQAGSDNETPRLVRTILPDKLTGIVAAQAITAALLARERGSGGQHVRVSMLAAIVAFLWGSDMSGQTFVGDEIDQQNAASFIDLIYETTDGHISVAVQTDPEWQALTRALNRPEWLQDERFATPALRQENIDERLRATQDVLRSNSTEYWLDRLDTEDVPCAPVLTRSEMINHPQVTANHVIWESEHAQAGPLRQASPAAQFSRTPAELRFGAPALGEHTEQVLSEHGYSDAEIEELIAENVVGSG